MVSIVGRFKIGKICRKACCLLQMSACKRSKIRRSCIFNCIYKMSAFFCSAKSFVKAVIAQPDNVVFQIKKISKSRIPQRKRKIVVVILLKPLVFRIGGSRCVFVAAVKNITKAKIISITKIVCEVGIGMTVNYPGIFFTFPSPFPAFVKAAIFSCRYAPAKRSFAKRIIFCKLIKIFVACIIKGTARVYKSFFAKRSRKRNFSKARIKRQFRIKKSFKCQISLQRFFKLQLFHRNVNYTGNRAFIFNAFCKAPAHNFNFFNSCKIYGRKIKGSVLSIIHANAINHNAHSFISKAPDACLVIKSIRPILQHLNSTALHKFSQIFAVGFLNVLSSNYKFLFRRGINVGSNVWQDNAVVLGKNEKIKT